MTSMPHLASIAYTHRDQMRYADLGGGGDAYYTYDGGGERVLKRIDRGSGHFVERIYLGGWEIFRDRDGSGVETERETLHVMDDTRRIAMVETLTVDEGDAVTTPVPRLRYQYGNHLESAMLECDEDGEVISYEEYHPYGTAAYRSSRSGVEVSEKRYRYTGKERDEETGFSYHRWRYYAPWLARWSSTDPEGIRADGPNLFQYARGNPVGLRDLAGTEAKTMYLGASKEEKYVSRLEKTWGGNQYWSASGSHGAGWYVRTEGRHILKPPGEHPATESIGQLLSPPGKALPAEGTFPTGNGIFRLRLEDLSSPVLGAGLSVHISFVAGPGAPDSEHIRLIQIVRSEDLDSGGEHEWKDDEAPRNAVRTTEERSRGVRPGFFIDHHPRMATIRTDRDSPVVSPFYSEYQQEEPGATLRDQS
jgi:RHS repeat-associated protein